MMVRAGFSVMGRLELEFVNSKPRLHLCSYSQTPDLPKG